MAKSTKTKRTDDDNWVRPAHSGFEGPMIGEPLVIWD